MPRLIDHAEREREIADAAIAVLARDGLSGLSVRGVAAEASIGAASLRRAFPTQNALRRFCIDVIRERAGVRIAAVGGKGSERALGIMTELLPLDEQRRVELLAQLQLGVLALTQDELREPTASLAADVRRVCMLAVAEIVADGGVSEASILRASDELHAFIDGLALHALLTPERVSAAVAGERLTAYLEAVPSRLM